MNCDRKKNLSVVRACIAARKTYDDAMKAIWKGVPATIFDIDNLIQEMAESKKRLDEIMIFHNRFSI